MNQRNVVASHIVLSLATAGMLVLISWLTLPQGRELSSTDQLIIVSAFIASCVFGLVQSTTPNRLRGEEIENGTVLPGPEAVNGCGG